MSDFYQPMNFGAVADHSFDTTFNVIKAMADEKNKMTLQQIMLPLTIAKTQAETAGMTAAAAVRAAQYKLFTERANAVAQKAATGNSWNYDDDPASGAAPLAPNDPRDPGAVDMSLGGEPFNLVSPQPVGDGASLSTGSDYQGLASSGSTDNPLVASFGGNSSSPFDGMQNVDNLPGGETVSVGNGASPVTLPATASISPNAAKAFSGPAPSRVPNPKAVSDVFNNLPDAPKATSSPASSVPKITLDSLSSKQDSLDRELARKLRVINNDTAHTDAEKAVEQRSQMMLHKTESDILARQAARLQRQQEAEAKLGQKGDSLDAKTLLDGIERQNAILVSTKDAQDPETLALRAKVIQNISASQEKLSGILSPNAKSDAPDWVQNYRKMSDDAKEISSLVQSNPGDPVVTIDGKPVKYADAKALADQKTLAVTQFENAHAPSFSDVTKATAWAKDPANANLPMKIVMTGPDGKPAAPFVAYASGPEPGFLADGKPSYFLPRGGSIPLATLKGSVGPDTVTAASLAATKVDPSNPLSVEAYQQNAQALVDQKLNTASDLQKQIDAEQAVIDRAANYKKDALTAGKDPGLAALGAYTGHAAGAFDAVSALKLRNEATARQAVLKAKLLEAQKELVAAQSAKARHAAATN